MKAPRSAAFQRFLKNAAVFGGLEGRSMLSVIDRLQEHKVAARQEIFGEGELGRTMYVLFKGEVDVLRATPDGKQVSIVKLGPGECFGEMALVELQPRSATVMTTKPSVLYSLNNLDLYHLFKADNYAYTIVLQNICRLLSRRLRKADSRLSEYLSRGTGAPPAARRRSGAKPARTTRAR